MSTAAILLLLVLAAALVYFLGRAMLSGWLATRGTRVVRCPGTHEPAAVELDGWQATKTATLDRPRLRVKDCSDWPERADCAQACLLEIGAAEDGCRVRSLLTSWYAGASCEICRREFEEIHWHDHTPAALDDRGKTHDWDEFRPEQLQEVFETHRPICRDCHVAERFRREHGERVVDRPWRGPVRRGP